MTSVESGHAFDSNFCFADLMTLSREGSCDNTAKIRVVVYDEDVCHYRTP